MLSVFIMILSGSLLKINELERSTKERSFFLRQLQQNKYIFAAVYGSKTAHKKNATFIPFLSPALNDGSHRLKIKLHHNNQRRIISTEILVTPKDLTKKGKIKNTCIEIEIQKILQEFRQKIQQLGMKTATMSIEKIHRQLKMPAGADIDFIKFTEGLIENYKKDNKPGMARNYNAAIRSLIAFTERKSINGNELTSRFFSN